MVERDGYGSVTETNQVLHGNLSIEKKKDKRRFFGRYEGIVYSILVGACYVAMATAMKYLQELNANELNMYASVLAFSNSLPFIIGGRYKMPSFDRKTILLWTTYLLMGLVAMVTRITAFQMLPLGESSSIIFSIPFFTAIFSRVFLKARLSWMMVISLIISLVGLLLTVRIPEIISHSQVGSIPHLIGCAYAFASVICTVVLTIVMSQLRHIHPVINSCFLYLGLSVLSACLVPAFGGFHHLSCSAGTSVAFLSLGVTFYLAVYFAFLALRTEDATTFSTLLRSSDMILSFVVQVLFFKDAVDAYSISGALLVFSCGLLIPLQRWMEDQPEGSPWKNSWLIK